MLTRFISRHPPVQRCTVRQRPSSRFPPSDVVRTSPLHAVVVPLVFFTGGDVLDPVDDEGRDVLRWTPDEQVYVVGHDLGLGQFETLVLANSGEDGFETFLSILRQVRTPILWREYYVVVAFVCRVTGTRYPSHGLGVSCYLKTRVGIPFIPSAVVGY